MDSTSYQAHVWITGTDAAHVLWKYGDPGDGVEPGEFVKALLEAIARADYLNRGKLGAGFPGYVTACNVAESTPDGLKILAEIAATRPGAFVSEFPPAAAEPRRHVRAD